MSLDDIVTDHLAKIASLNPKSDGIPNTVEQNEVDVPRLITLQQNEAKEKVRVEISKPPFNQSDDNRPSLLVEEKDIQYNKPKRRKCNASFISESSGLPIRCRRNALDGSDLCKEHYEIEEAKVEAAKSKEPKYAADIAARSLFKLQLCAMKMAEHTDKIFNADHKLEGLTNRFIEDEDDFKEMYARLYEEKGHEYIDQVIDPVAMILINTAGIFGETIMVNEKKRELNTM